jgi:hypothetical protein
MLVNSCDSQYFWEIVDAFLVMVLRKMDVLEFVQLNFEITFKLKPS